MILFNIPHRKYAKCKYSVSFRTSVKLIFALIIFVVTLSPASFLLSSNASGENFGPNYLIGRINDSNQGQPAIAVDNAGIIYVIWSEENASTLIDTIWVAKSSNGGISFDFVKRINENADWSQTVASIAIGSDGKVHIVWLDHRAGLPGIYYANSTDGGFSFNPNIRVMDPTAPCGCSMSVARRSTAVDKNNKIHVVWSDIRNGNASVYYTNSTNGGISFNPDVKVSDTDGHATQPSIAVDENDNIYVVWEDYRDMATKGADIYFSKSIDSGISFSPSKGINDDLGSAEQWDPSIAVKSGIIAVVWDDARNGGRDIYSANSTDEGDNFSVNKMVNDDPLGGQWIPSIAINKTGYIGVVWEDGRNGNWDVYFANSTDGGNTFSANQRVNDDVGTEFQYTPHIAIDDNGIVYVVWQDYRSGTIWDTYFTRTNVPPPVEPPTNLSAELTGDSLENVTISWDASLDDPVNVTNYALYYNTHYNSYGLNYKFLTEVSALGASKYYLTVLGIGEGDPNNYFFYVQANSTVGFSCARNDTQVAKFTKSLATGIQLISIPLILNNTNMSNVLQTLDYKSAWYYNNTDVLDPWKSYNPSKPFNDLMTINRTMAFWVNVTGDSNLTIAGIVPKITNIELKQGWNFVGYPSFIKRIVADALSNANCERIEGYSQSPPEYLRFFSDDDFLAPMTS